MDMKKAVVGGILLCVGLFLSLGFFLNAMEKGVDAGDIAAVVLLGIAPVIGGGMLIRSHFKEKQKAVLEKQAAIQTQQEKEIIRLAQQKGGRLSIPEIVAGTSLNTIEADQLMREMTTKGYVDMQVTDAGVIIYEFYEIAHRNKLEE
jgi:hypothetical protein